MFGKGITINRLGFGNKIGERVSNASFIGSFLLLGAGIVIKGLTQWMYDPLDYMKIIDDMKETGEASIGGAHFKTDNSEQA